MKKRLTALLLLGVLLTASSCGDSEKLLKSTKEDQSVVMTAGGFDVPLEVYRYVALNHKDAYEAGKDGDIWLGESGEALLKELYADIDETIAFMYLPLILAEEYGLSIEDKVITESVDLKMDAVYESYDFDYKQYVEDISSYHMNDGTYRFIMLNEVMTEELFHAMILNGDIETDDAHLTEVFESDEFIRVKQILVSADNGKTAEENRAYAEELLDMVNDGGDFDYLVQKYGQDLFMFNNNDGYYMMKGSYYEEFEEAAFSLEIGEVSGVVETPAGFSIIKRYEKEAAYLENHREDLAQTYYDGVFNLKLEGDLPSVVVEKTKLFDKYGVFNLD